MQDDGGSGLLRASGRALLFSLSLAFAIGWLIAPDRISRERDRVAELLHLGAYEATHTRPVRSFPADERFEPSPLRQVAARTSKTEIAY
jgi:hypothetical protein